MKKLLFLLAVLFCWYQPANATVLGDAANALSPGQWVMMSSGTGAGQMGNLNATASNPAWDTAAGAPGPAYDGGQPAWNSNTNQLLIQTTEHGRAGGLSPYCDSDYWICSWPVYPTAAWKPIWTYDAATNNWTIPSALNSGAYPNSSGSPVTGIHVWGSIAWDNTNQVMYVRKHADTTTRIYRYCAPTSPASYCAGQLGTYSAIPQSYTFLADEVHGQAMGWHPTYNGGTLMIFAPSGGGTGCGALAGFKEGTTGSNGTWTTINNPYPSCTFPTSASFLHRAIYSSQNQLLVVLGGGLQTYRITNTAAIQRIDDAPCSIGTTNGNFATGAEDPNTGDIYFLACENQPNGNPTQLIRLNPAGASKSQWSVVQSVQTAGNICNVASTDCATHVYATPISTYGVIGFWKWRQVGLAEYWLYKPSATSGDTTPPTVAITAPTGGATVSGSLVTVTASASDNVGVSGVQFRVDGVNVGAEDTGSPYSIAWNSTTVTDGSHAITAVARDAAGNTTTSTTVNVTVANGGGGGSDFTTRCAQPGVVRCIGFDSGSDIACSQWGCNTGVDLTYTAPGDVPVIDTANKASGNGSLKFTISSLTGAGSSGAYWANFSTDLSARYGAGQTFYVQWRQRFSPELINTVYTKTCLPGPACPGGSGNAGGWKLGIITVGDYPGGCPASDITDGWCQNQLGVGAYASCTPIEVTPQNTDQRKFLQGYNSCSGSSSHTSPYWAFNYPFSGDFKLQNARPSPYCLYSQGPNNYFPPNGNCVALVPNEWMTFKVKITMGPRGSGAPNGSEFTGTPGAAPNDEWVNSNVSMWVARDGQASLQVLDYPFNLTAYKPSADQKFGKIYLTPYHTSKNEAQVHATAYTWYDELIISTADIADPGGSPPVVNAPSQIRVTRR